MYGGQNVDCTSSGISRDDAFCFRPVQIKHFFRTNDVFTCHCRDQKSVLFFSCWLTAHPGPLLPSGQVVEKLEGPAASHECALRLLQDAVAAHEYPLAGEVRHERALQAVYRAYFTVSLVFHSCDSSARGNVCVL